MALKTDKDINKLEDALEKKVTPINELPKEDKKPLEENVEIPTEDVAFDGEIDLSATRKKRFRIDGDNNRYIEIDTSDMGIITRLDTLYPRLEKLSQEASFQQIAKSETDDESKLTKISQALIKIDAQMRQIVDDIFASNVSEMCAPSGTMFDPFNGEFRYEHIVDVISKLYTENVNKEFRKMAARVKKHTAKYTKGR